VLKYRRIPSTAGTRDLERSRFFHKLSAALSHEAIGEADAPALAALHTATDGRGAPLPAVDPRLIAESGSESGAVGLDSPFYVRRAADDALENRIKGPARDHGDRPGRPPDGEKLAPRAGTCRRSGPGAGRHLHRFPAHRSRQAMRSG